MKKESGFTVIEVIIAIAIFLTIGIVLLIQRNNLIVSHNDSLRKIAVNSIYYDLTEVYFKEHGYYPLTINAENLVAIDSALLTDPNGIEFNDPQSDYYYDAIDCSPDGKCKSFEITAKMDKEAQYIRKSE